MRTLLSIILALYCFNVLSQDSNPVLIPFLENNNYGFVNKDGKLIIPAKYESTLPFYVDYELTTAFISGNPVIINRKGKVILKASSDYFLLDSLINNVQDIKAKPEALAIREFCLCESCPTFIVTQAYEAGKLFDKISDFYFVGKDKKVFLIDKKGKEKSKKYDRIRHYDYGEMEYCLTEDQVNNTYGLINDKGETVLQAVYNVIEYTGNGVFKLKQGDFERNITLKTRAYNNLQENTTTHNLFKISREDGRFGIVDTNGTVIIQASYDKLYPLDDNKYVFIKENQIGIMDTNEVHIFSTTLSGLSMKSSFSVYSPKSVFFIRDNKWILIDIKGKQKGEEYDGVFIDYLHITGTKAGVCVNNKMGVIDETGIYIIKPAYDSIYCLREDKSFIVKAGSKWSWLSANGKEIYKDFDDFKYILKDFLFILKDGKWFYVNSKGKEFRN